MSEKPEEDVYVDNVTKDLVLSEIAAVSSKLDKLIKPTEAYRINYTVVIFVVLLSYIIFIRYYANPTPKSTYQVKRNVDFIKYPKVTHFEDVTEQELNQGYIEQYYIEELFSILEFYLRNENKTCVSLDYVKMKNNKKKLIGVLINNKKDFIPMINPRITGFEDVNVTTKATNFCSPNSTTIFNMRKSIIVDYIYYQYYSNVPIEGMVHSSYMVGSKHDVYLKNINQFEGIVSNCLEIMINKINGFNYC